MSSNSESRSASSDGEVLSISSGGGGNEGKEKRKLSRSGQSVTSLLSAAMDAFNGGAETKGAIGLASNSSGAGSEPDNYSSDEENLAQAQEDDRVIVQNGSVISTESESNGSGMPSAQTWTFSCQDLLDIVLENMSHEAESILAERGIIGATMEAGKQGRKKFDYLSVEALATHRNNVKGAVGSNPNLQTFIAELPHSAQLDSKGSVLSDGSGSGSAGVGAGRSASSTTTLTATSPLPPLPTQVVPNVLPLVGTREEYMLMAAEEDGSIMDDLPPFKMQANVTSVGVNDFVVVKKQGDTVMMHVRIEETEKYGSKFSNTAQMDVGKGMVSSSSQSNIAGSHVSASIAITPSSQQGPLGATDTTDGKSSSGSAASGNTYSAYRYFAPAILGRSSTDPSAGATTTSASRTFASYLGWTSATTNTNTTTATTVGGSGGGAASIDFSIAGGSTDGGSVFSGSDSHVTEEFNSEGKEEREPDQDTEEKKSLPAEFDEEYTRSRYLDRQATRRSMSITEGVGWVAHKDNDIYNQIKHSGGRGRILVKVRKPMESDVDWKSIHDVVISAKHSGESVDTEIAKASYEALLREQRQAQGGGNGVVTGAGDAGASDGTGTNGRGSSVGGLLSGLMKQRVPATTTGTNNNNSESRDQDEDFSLASMGSQDEGCYELDAATGEMVMGPAESGRDGLGLGDTPSPTASLGSLSLSASDKRGNPALDDPFGMSMEEDDLT